MLYFHFLYTLEVSKYTRRHITLTRSRVRVLLLSPHTSLGTMPVSAADVDRLFLQAVLSRGLLSTKLAQSLWEKSIDAVNGIKNL